MNLSHWTIEALSWKATVASDSIVENDPETNCWIKVIDECTRVKNIGTVEALRKNKRALDELENYLLADLPPEETYAINKDLCRAGYHEVFNPKAVTTRKLRTMKVDGIQYIIG